MQRSLNFSFTGTVLNKYLRIDYASFEEAETYDIISRMGNSTCNQLYNVFLNTVNLLSIFISIIGLVLVFAQVSKPLSILCMMIVVLIIVLDVKYTNEINSILVNQTFDERTRSYYSDILSDKDALLELKVFGATDYILGEWNKLADILSNDRIRLFLQAQRFQLASSICVVLWVGFVVCSLIKGLDSQAISLGVFVAMIGSATQLVNHIESLSHAYMNLMERNIRIEYYERFMSLPDTDIGSSDDAIAEPIIRFNNVYFKYKGNENPVLNGVTFTINPRESIALVGRNGAVSQLLSNFCVAYISQIVEQLQ